VLVTSWQLLSIAAAFLRFYGLVILYRSITEQALYLVSFLVADSGSPARTRFNIAGRQKSCGMDSALIALIRGFPSSPIAVSVRHGRPAS